MRVTAFVILVATGAMAGDGVEKDPYQLIRKNIQSILRDGKLGPDQLKQIEGIGDDLARRWRDSDLHLYARATDYLAGRMGSFDFHDDRQDGVRQRLVMQALEKADEFSLYLELRLVRHLRHFVDANGEQLPGTKSWPEARRQISSQWLHAWGRLERTIDPDWDRKKVPTVHPRGFPEVPGGASPDAITDPVRREKYKRALAENDKKKRAYALQSRARRLAKRFIPKAKQLIKNAYGTSPSAREELAKLLDKHLPAPATRRDFLREFDGKR